MQSVDSGGGCACMETENIWELLVFSSQFFCESKIALKNKVYFFKIPGKKILEPDSFTAEFY